MKFRYRSFNVALFDGEPASEIFRPIAPLLIHGPDGSALIYPLLDCGADYTLLPNSVADAVGIELDTERPGTVGGIEGGSVVTYPGDAELELSDKVESYRWPTLVRFTDSNNMLLGHLGFLEFFTAIMDHHGRTFELTLNDAFPA